MNGYKTFNDFGEGLAELCSISNKAAETFGFYGYSEDEDNETPIDSHEDACALLISIISTDIPSVFDEDYPMSRALNISANDVGYKCPGQVSFGWHVRVNNNGDPEYSFRISINTKPEIALKSSTLRKAKELGWNLVESARYNNPSPNNNNRNTAPSIQRADHEEVSSDDTNE